MTHTHRSKIKHFPLTETVQTCLITFNRVWQVGRVTSCSAFKRQTCSMACVMCDTVSHRWGTSAFIQQMSVLSCWKRAKSNSTGYIYFQHKDKSISHSTSTVCQYQIWCPQRDYLSLIHNNNNRTLKKNMNKCALKHFTRYRKYIISGDVTKNKDV